jgi:hypothetical protein
MYIQGKTKVWELELNIDQTFAAVLRQDGVALDEVRIETEDIPEPPRIYLYK